MHLWSKMQNNIEIEERGKYPLKTDFPFTDVKYDSFSLGVGFPM